MMSHMKIGAPYAIVSVLSVLTAVSDGVRRVVEKVS